MVSFTIKFDLGRALCDLHLPIPSPNSLEMSWHEQRPAFRCSVLETGCDTTLTIKYCKNHQKWFHLHKVLQTSMNFHLFFFIDIHEKPWKKASPTSHKASDVSGLGANREMYQALFFLSSSVDLKPSRGVRA